jgi:aspartate kinase
MKVLKFGSSAVASAQRIKDVASLIANAKGKGNIIVLSAMSGTTDILIEIADYLYKKNPDGAKELPTRWRENHLNLQKSFSMKRKLKR